MKRIIFFIGCLFLISSTLVAQTNGVVFNETTHDFGNVDENGGSVSFDFILTNNTKEPLLITRATASCGCTTPTWTREPIEPGKTGKVKALFNPKGRPGPFSKTLTVYTSNSSDKPSRLYIKGNVSNAKKVNAKDKYTKKLGKLLMNEQRIEFGAIEPSNTTIIQLEVYNDSNAPFVPEFTNLPSYLTVTTTPSPIPAQSSALIKLELNASAAGYGNHEGILALQMDSTSYDFPYSALVADDFSKLNTQQKERAGRINTSTDEIDFGNLKSGNSRTLKFSNSGKTDLHIKMIQTSGPSVTVSMQSLTVKPNEIKDVKITLDKKVNPGFEAFLTVFSDDPFASVRTINIKTTP